MVMRHNKKGFNEWMVQRVSAVIIAAYTIFMLAYLATHAPLTYSVWRQLFDNVLMRVSTIMVVIAILWHAWIGLWTVFTDYIKNNSLRMTLQVLLCLLLLGYVIWCLDIMWR